MRELDKLADHVSRLESTPGSYKRSLSIRDLASYKIIHPKRDKVERIDSFIPSVSLVSVPIKACKIGYFRAVQQRREVAQSAPYKKAGNFQAQKRPL